MLADIEQFGFSFIYCNKYFREGSPHINPTLSWHYTCLIFSLFLTIMINYELHCLLGNNIHKNMNHKKHGGLLNGSHLR